MRVAHRTTGLTGTVTGHCEALHGQPGPWLYVEWDDGLTCWVLETSVIDATARALKAYERACDEEDAAFATYGVTNAQYEALRQASRDAWKEYTTHRDYAE